MKVQVRRCCRWWSSPIRKSLLPRRLAIVCWRFRQSFSTNYKLKHFHCGRTCSALPSFRLGSSHIQLSSTCHRACSKADIFWPRTTIPNIPEQRSLSSPKLLGSCQTRELVLECLLALRPAILVKFWRKLLKAKVVELFTNLLLTHRTWLITPKIELRMMVSWVLRSINIKSRATSWLKWSSSFLFWFQNFTF